MPARRHGQRSRSTSRLVLRRAASLWAGMRRWWQPGVSRGVVLTASGAAEAYARPGNYHTEHREPSVASSAMVTDLMVCEFERELADITDPATGSCC